MLSLDDAIRFMRERPEYAAVVHDAYLGADSQEAAQRFARSDEFAEVCALLGARRVSGTVVDLGAGTGIASYAFARAGATRVVAVEPDPSCVVGRGAVARLAREAGIEVIAAGGERIPMRDGSADVVYGRQVLHHITNLETVLKECARVLKVGGALLVCREHVVDDEQQLQAFLRGHPVHALAGGENAHPLDAYLNAIRHAGLNLESTFAPFDSVINAFPEARSRDELARMPRALLARRFGFLGRLAATLPGAERFALRRLNRSRPGRLYSFLATKAVA